MNPPNDPDRAAELLTSVREWRQRANQAEIQAVEEAIHWLHSVALPSTKKPWIKEMAVGGDGAPQICETSVIEFAAVQGMSPSAARSYLACAWDLECRLPLTHAVLLKGTLPMWRAREIADSTHALTAEAVAYIDTLVAPIAHKVSLYKLRQLVVEAEALFDPEAAERRAIRDAEGRTIDVYPPRSHDGLADITGHIDAADAAEFDAAIAMVAAELGKVPDQLDSLDVRRAKAVGIIARRQLSGWTGTTPEVRVIHTYVHLTPTSPMARVEGSHTLVPVDRIREWCTTAGTKVLVRPVLDLAEHHSRDGYVPTETMREQAIVLNETCVHPYCTRQARSADIDHIRPYQLGGPPAQTASENLAPLCRQHHRIKTHAGWNYQQIEPGSFLWHSPTGASYLRCGASSHALLAELRT